MQNMVWDLILFLTSYEKRSQDLKSLSFSLPLHSRGSLPSLKEGSMQFALLVSVGVGAQNSGGESFHSYLSLSSLYMSVSNTANSREGIWAPTTPPKEKNSVLRRLCDEVTDRVLGKAWLKFRSLPISPVLVGQTCFWARYPYIGDSHRNSQ